MRVLTIGNMYPPHHLGGYEITWADAVDHLRSHGHPTRVLTTDFRREGVADDQADVHRTLRWYWQDHRFPRRSLRERIALERHNARELARQLEDFRPDVVSWWAMGGMSLGLIEQVRRAGLPARGTVGDDWMDYGPKVDGWQRACARIGGAATPASRALGINAAPDLSRAARWQFNSARTLETAVDAGLDRSRTEIVHPGVDERLFAPTPDKPWQGRLACVGRLDPRKGVTTAIEALAQLPDVTLRIVGGGDDRHRDALQARAHELGVADRVSFAELPRERVAQAYADADALVFPVLWEEPWGLVPLEAMACGTPVLATGAGGGREYLRDGQNTLLFAPGDAGALTGVVRRLAADATLRANLRAEGLSTAVRYSEEAFARGVRLELEAAASARPGQS